MTTATISSQTRQSVLGTVAAHQGQALRGFLNRTARPAAAPAPTQAVAAATQAVAPVTSIVGLNALLAQIPTGSYALPRTDGGLDFFEVVERRGGRRFLNQLRGGVGDFTRIQLNMRFQSFAAGHILQDTLASAKLFADEYRVCARCYSPLTKELSRARGLGPDCYKVY